MRVCSPFMPEMADGGTSYEVQDLKIDCGSANVSLKGEDKWTIRSPTTVGTDTLHILMVADGHGGATAAQWCQDNLVDVLIGAMEGDASSAGLYAAAHKAFKTAHTTVQGMPGVTAGATLTVVVLNATRREITTANVGDSNAILVTGKQGCVPLNEDHRIDTNEKERERLQALGAKIAHATGKSGQPVGPLRLWPGGVAMGRSIGDADVGIYIDATPAVSTIPLPDGTGEIIVCSDGVWDAMLVPSVGAHARRCRGVEVQRTAQLLCGASVDARHAYNCDGYQVPRDDTTCVMMRFSTGDEDTGGGDGCLSVCSANGDANAKTPPTAPDSPPQPKRPVTPRDENLTPVASRRPVDTAPLADPMEVQVGDISG